jgi:hypothetical protein
VSWWTHFRDNLETAAGIVANYYYPGSGILGQWVNSKGSQEQLYGTGWGQAALALGGVAGGMSGNMANYTGGAASAGGATGDLGAGFTGTTTMTADPGALDAASRMIQQGVDPAQAVQMAGMTPAQADAAGLSAGAGQTWQDVAQQSGIPYSGGGVGQGGMVAPSGISNVGTLGQGGMTPQAASVAKSAGAMPWGSAPSNMNVASGIYGLLQSQQMAQMAQAAQRAADPFAQYRGYYGDQLKALTQDPNSITKLPGYQAGLEAVQRSMAAQGFAGSGNMATALQKYGGDFYNQTMDRYAQLAGAGANPAAAAQLGLGGAQYGVELAGRSLGTLGNAATWATMNPYGYQQYGGQQGQQTPYWMGGGR